MKQEIKHFKNVGQSMNDWLTSLVDEGYIVQHVVPTKWAAIGAEVWITHASAIVYKPTKKSMPDDIGPM